MNAFDAIQKQRKQDLISFWERMGGKVNYGKDIPRDVKLAELQKMCETVYINRSKTLSKYRRKFNRYYKSTFNFPCFLCGGATEHRHHIIPLKNGGNNSKQNRIGLCKECHMDVHPWMRNSQ